MLRLLLLWLIRLYQTRVSPHKGFHCAYRARKGRWSCSAFGFAAISRHGALVGLLLLRRRFHKCSDAALAMPPPRPRFRPKHQAGHCDVVPVGDCHGHGCESLASVPCDSCGFNEDRHCRRCGSFDERLWKRSRRAR